MHVHVYVYIQTKQCLRYLLYMLTTVYFLSKNILIRIYNFRETEFPVRFINYVNRDLSERLSDVEDDEDVSVNQEAEKLLWVEKFAPRTYTDLLSEEVGWE